MALNGKVLGDAIADIIISPDAPSGMKSQIRAQWEVIGSAIVEHFQKNAVVSVKAGIAVSTTGSSNAQSGATTAEGIGVIK